MQNELENFDNEQWRDIDGYDGAYQVSDLGRVRSKKYGRWKVMKQVKSSTGYLNVGLLKDGKRKTFLTHRLVAQAFIDNDDETKTYINHRNEDKTENKVSNLEWCTASYNLSYNDLNLRRKNYKRHKLKELYNPELSIDDNLEIFRVNGIECSRVTVIRLRRDLGISKKYTKRS